MADTGQPAVAAEHQDGEPDVDTVAAASVRGTDGPGGEAGHHGSDAGRSGDGADGTDESAAGASAESAGSTDDPGDGEPPTSTAERPRRKLPFWVELPALIVTALVLTFLIQTFVARVYIIPSGSMELTLNGQDGVGDRILVDEVVYDFHDPRPGDVVVFRGPNSWVPNEYQVSSSSNPVVHWLRQFGAAIGIGKPDEYDLVKRVIAVGGQTISCCDPQNRVVVDGKPLTEPYVYWEPDRGGPAQQLRFGPVTIPQGYLWVMGDNRNNSDDSRIQNGGGINGIVPVGNVIGKARTIIWPPSRWQGIGDYDAQTQALGLAAPGWVPGLPAGIGIVGAWPTLWLGRRIGRRLRRFGRVGRER
jgi:signal peptidase I